MKCQRPRRWEQAVADLLGQLARSEDEGEPERTTMRRLATNARNHGPAAGHPSLARIGRGTVSKVLRAHPVRLHKITY